MGWKTPNTHPTHTQPTYVLISLRVDNVAVLLDEALRPLAEANLRLTGPPVNQVARLVKLLALVVEAVGDLVADDGANRRNVHVRRPARVEEGRVENGRRNG